MEMYWISGLNGFCAFCFGDFSGGEVLPVSRFESGVGFRGRLD